MNEHAAYRTAKDEFNAARSAMMGMKRRSKKRSDRIAQAEKALRIAIKNCQKAGMWKSIRENGVNFDIVQRPDGVFETA